MILSILVPTMSSRASLLSRLLWGLEPQLTDDVEVLIHPGDDIAMGDKYSRMFKEANGLYVTCVDDDDYLASDYVALVLRALSHSPDYVGYKILHTEDGKYMGEVSSSITGDASWQKQPFGPLPKCVVRKDVAAEANFPNNHSGDNIWGQAIQDSGKLKTEQTIDKVLYYYDFWLKGSLGTLPGSKAKQRDVGMYPYTKEKFKWLS